MHYTPKQFKTVISHLVEIILHRELSAYKKQYEDINPIVEIHHDKIADGFLVWFKVGGFVKTDFTYLNGSHDELDAHVREAIVRILGLSNI